MPNFSIQITNKVKDRELYATITVNNLINDLQSNVIDVGFLDATNTTLERRQKND